MRRKIRHISTDLGGLLTFQIHPSVAYNLDTSGKVHDSTLLQNSAKLTSQTIIDWCIEKFPIHILE